MFSEPLNLGSSDSPTDLEEPNISYDPEEGTTNGDYEYPNDPLDLSLVNRDIPDSKEVVDFNLVVLPEFLILKNFFLYRSWETRRAMNLS